MSIKRRTLNGCLLGGFVAGAGFGFVAGRYSDGSRAETGSRSAEELLQHVALAAPGIHLVGLAMEHPGRFRPEAAERRILSAMGFEGSQYVTKVEFHAALSRAISKDFAEGDTIEVNQYLLSRTESLFARYALDKQGLLGVAYEATGPEVRDGHIASDVKFGPAYTVVGEVFNEQPDGHGALWIQAKNTPPGTVILINDKPIQTTRKPELLTGAVYGDFLEELIAVPARHDVALFVPDTGIRQVLGEMEVRPRPPAAIMENGRPSTVFCEIDGWSITKSVSVERIVVETFCGPRTATIYLGEIALQTRVGHRTIEGTLNRSFLGPSAFPVRLVDVQSGEALLIGHWHP